MNKNPVTLLKHMLSTHNSKNKRMTPRLMKLNTGLKYIPLQYPNKDRVATLRPTATIKNYHKCVRNPKNNAMQMESFLTNLQVGDPTKEHRYVTWSELYILFGIRGNQKLIPDAKGPKPKATLSKQMVFSKANKGHGQQDRSRK